MRSEPMQHDEAGGDAGAVRSLAQRRRVLVCGASVAGPALAYWLWRYGFEVTVIELAGAIRPGGYPVDLRGSAMQVAERMGLAPALRRAHIDSVRLTFVDGDGVEIAAVAPESVTGGVRGRDVELPRGELAFMLYQLTCGEIDYRFNTAILALADQDDGVTVSFSDGSRAHFDLVIGADGMHSRTRGLVFGQESRFARPLGFYFAGFSVPNSAALSQEAFCANVPGRMAAIYAAGKRPDAAFALLAFSHPYALGAAARDPVLQRELTAMAFAGAGWIVPGLLDAMRAADDFYFDAVQQVHMPAWSKGRVALVGDAAYAPSFLAGQGSSMALVGAYVLASELALHASHVDAFAAHERQLRQFVLLNQATVQHGKAGMIPATQERLSERNAALRERAAAPPAAPRGRAAHSALDLSRYDGLLRACCGQAGPAGTGA